LTREVDGFIANRLQAALLWEAFRLLEAGIATAEDIDKTISEGLGRRWTFIGPFQTIDLNAPGGLEDYAARLGAGFFEFVKQGEPAEPWSDAVIAKAHGEMRDKLPLKDQPARQAWRDKRLMALAKHFQEVGE
jgi:3-hydroxyacyl-CoA dehydrogenase